jgi:hypothetical protein
VSAPPTPADRWPGGHAQSPGGQLAPYHASLAREVEALAVLLAEVVELTRTGAVYPGDLAAVAEEAQRQPSVHRALAGERVSAPSAALDVRAELTTVVQHGVIALAEQAPTLTDPQLRSRLTELADAASRGESR